MRILTTTHTGWEYTPGTRVTRLSFSPDHLQIEFANGMVAVEVVLDRNEQTALFHQLDYVNGSALREQFDALPDAEKLQFIRDIL